jgi:signal transduction histidine kinase
MYQRKLKFDLLVHDLKAPLAVIETGITSLLKKVEQYGPLTEQQDRVLQRVLRNTRIAQTLVNDTLELGRSQNGVMSLKNVKLSDLIIDSLVEIFDLTSIKTSRKIIKGQNLKQLKEVLAEVGLLLLIDKELWCREFFLDERKAKQILRNLLLNGIKYKESQVTLEFEKKEGHLFFSVTDDGKGIPPSYHDKIFEIYLQLDN